MLCELPFRKVCIRGKGGNERRKWRDLVP